MPLFPLQEIVMESVDDWNTAPLLDTNGTLAVISPMTPDYETVPHLFIDIQPLHSLRLRIKAELNHILDPISDSDRAAFEAMMAHLKLSELCRYPPERPTVGPAELRELSGMFQRKEIKSNGLFLVGRGYAPYLSKSISDLDSERYALVWTN